MKKPVILIAAAFVMLASLPAFSQSQNQYPKDAYVKSMHIERIWTHELGYVVQFFSSKSRLNSIYVPFTWFNKGIESRAEIVFGNTAEYPYFTIVWVDGKFDHITLYARQDYRDLTWGALPETMEVGDRFNVEDVPREF